MKIYVSTEQNNIETAISIDRIKNFKLDENKRYNIKIPIESAIAVVPTIKRINAKLVQQTDRFFTFKVKTKSGESKIETISKFDCLKDKSLINVIE